MRIVLLGTGAATPTLLRWPTSTAILRSRETLLFDCGEGTQVQFLRAKLKPGKLARIFISHFHGDHFNGLIGMLTSMQLSGRQKELQLYGPKGLAEYLTFMQSVSQVTFGYSIHLNEVAAGVEKTVWDMGEYTVTAMPLTHRMTTLGFRIEEQKRPGKFDQTSAERLGIASGPVRRLLKQGQTVELPDGTQVEPEQVIGPTRPGKKIAVCLDTVPCKNAVTLAKNVDVLIHEGTFETSKTAWAQDTGHSTAAQAANIAKEAGARKLILTHISARYDKTGEKHLLAEAREIFPNTIMGFDLMRVEVKSHPVVKSSNAQGTGTMNT